MSSDIPNLRRGIQELTADIRVFNRVAQTGRISGNDLLVILRMLRLPPAIDDAIVQMQVAIATINTLRMAFKLMQIEMGPLGWLLLGIGIFGGMVATAQMASSQDLALEVS